MAASVLEVLITGDATQLKLAFTQATAATKEYQAATASTTAATKQATTSASAFGRTASQAMNYAKLGALAFAAVSVKAAVDFNREFTLIAAVTNTTAERLDGLKSTVMDLARETGAAPTELAHSLYFLASAGLTTTQQMAALDATAKGTAIGLGTAGDLARITANALNAFADQGLSATQVMDVLTAAIREGSAEPDEFAGALGRVLPIADQAGISFAAVAASLATMSNAGLDVNEGVTALRAMLQSLVAPTAQTESAFKQMGLTVTDVVASMQGQGLIATLRLVEERARKSTDSTGEFNQMMRHAIPNIRGLAGALNLVHQDSTEVDAIFQRVINSGGDMAKAFATTAESDAFKLKQALNDISIAGQELATAVLPAASTALEFAATHAKVLLDTLIAYAAIRWVLPFLKSLTVQTEAYAAAETAAGAAVVGEASAEKAAAAIRGVQSMTRPTQFPVSGPSQIVPVNLGNFGPTAEKSIAPIDALGAASNNTSTAIGRMGNTIGSSGIPQILALTQAAQDALSEFQAFSKDGIGGAIDSVIHSTSFQQIGASVFGQSAVSFLDAAPTLEAAQKMFNGMQIIKDGFLALGTTADEQAQITNDALASMGKTSLEQINPDNIEAYVTAVQAQIDHTQALKASDEQAAAAQLELTKQTQAAHEATDTWQRSTAKMTDHLSGLSRIGIDVSDFMSQLQTDLAGSDDQAKTFGEAIDKVTQAWQDFKSAAVDSLTFAPQMLSDLSSAAQQAQDSLANMAPPAKDLHGQDLVDYNNNLADLQAQANLTGEEILQSFKDATAQTKSFGRDLEEIAKIGGDTGKALAASLLESGDVLSAQVIADAPQKLQKQITSWFGKSASAADKFGTQLTNAIVGPLDDIVTILAKIARQQFGIDLHLNDKDVRKKTKDDKKAIDDLVNKRHFVRMALKDDASPGIKTIRDDTTHLVANAHKLQFQINQEQVERQLSTMESNLDRLTSRKYTVNVGVHTGPKSPWPDEALKMHLTDPMKDTGFKRVGDTWTLPLSVGAHTDVGAPTNDPTTFPGGKGTRGDKKVPGLDALREIEKRQLQVLFDIRRELKTGGGGAGGGAGGSVAGGGTGTGGGGRGGLHGSLHEISPLKAAAAEIVRMTSKSGATLNEGLGVVQRIAAQGLNPAFMRHAVEGVRQELGKSAARQYQQQLRLVDQMTKDDAEKRAIARRAAYYAAHPDAHRATIDQQRFMTPLQRSVESIFQKVYKAGMTPGEARGMIARVAREGRDPKFIGGAIKDIAKELGPRAAREFGHSLRGLDASTARNAKHQQAALDAARDAFKQMTQHARQQAVQDTKQQQAREEARKQWMADTLAYATHNVPRLPRGHTNISVNHHERHKKHEVRLDRKRFTDSAAYEVDYARGF